MSSKEDRIAAKTHALQWADRLMFLGPVEVKNMFGGWAFRLDGITFASLMPDFSFRGDQTVAKDWEAMGATQFTYTFPKTGRTSHMPYWAFPQNILENQEKFEDLAVQSLKIAQDAKK